MESTNGLFIELYVDYEIREALKFVLDQAGRVRRERKIELKRLGRKFDEILNGRREKWLRRPVRPNDPFDEL
jgi:hypothetical protein